MLLIILQTPEEGSRTVVFAAIHPMLEGKGGGYYSNCMRFPQHKLAKDRETMKKLFEVSCKDTQITDFF